MFWGISPALNLQDEYIKLTEGNSSELNFLVIGGCDARHIIKTFAESYKYRKRQLNMYVVDGCPELAARQLLLLSMAFEKIAHVGLLEKTRRFLEIYGNLLLRPSTSRYLSSKSKETIKMITNPDYMASIMPSIAINRLKYRERDYMEGLMSFWSTGNTNQFDVCYLWDRRLRQSLTFRYDSKIGVFDWDYHMRMKEIAGQICWPEYKHFREHGVAFTWLETEVCRPNCSLVAGVYKCGERFLHRGYLGDMVCSPYVSYGLDCDDKDMLKSSHGTNYKRATDVSERNVMRMFYELENKTNFDPATFKIIDDQNLGMVVLQNIDAKMSADADTAPLNLGESKNTYIDINCGKIHFLSLSALENLPLKTEYQNFFDGVFVGYTTTNKLTPETLTMVNDDAFVIFETRKYLVDYKRDDIIAFGDQIKQQATAAKCSLTQDFDPQKDDFAKFIIKRNTFKDFEVEATESVPSNTTSDIQNQNAAGELFFEKDRAKSFEIFEDPEQTNKSLLRGKVPFEIYEDEVKETSEMRDKSHIENITNNFILNCDEIRNNLSDLEDIGKENLIEKLKVVDDVDINNKATK